MKDSKNPAIVLLTFIKAFIVITFALIVVIDGLIKLVKYLVKQYQATKSIEQVINPYSSFIG
jgi:predicted PurR-regulated permease PerM